MPATRSPGTAPGGGRFWPLHAFLVATPGAARASILFPTSMMVPCGGKEKRSPEGLLRCTKRWCLPGEIVGDAGANHLQVTGLHVDLTSRALAGDQRILLVRQANIQPLQAAVEILGESVLDA